MVADFFLKYPLYVTTLDKSDGVIHQTEGEIVCVGQQCSNEKHEQRRKLFSKDYVRLIGISPDLEEFEEERVDIICDVTNINIAVKQTYKDKQTLTNVMEFHAFMKQFSYRTERSSGSRPIVVVDEAALKSFYGGTMLTASMLGPGVNDKCILLAKILVLQALDTFNAAIISPVYYVMFTTLTIIASAIMFMDWAGQNDSNIVYEMCGFITVLPGIIVLHVTREQEPANPPGKNYS
ncbi:putative magnesium transporter NIPA7 [Capsicum chinense]|nr:putative magnesium transporter NIPA7 [Capsicum chinense]